MWEKLWIWQWAEAGRTSRSVNESLEDFEGAVCKSLVTKGSEGIKETEENIIES